MPDFTIETTYHLPIFRNRTFLANSLEDACRAAVADDNWDIAEKDYDSSGAVHVTGIWQGTHTAHSGLSQPIPAQFDEPVQRRARHFEILLGLVKILLDHAHTGKPSTEWQARSAWAIARGEAILAGRPDPEEPVDQPKMSHVLARLQEGRVRDALAEIIEIDPDFSNFPADQVTEEDIHFACLETVATLSFSDEIGNAEFRTAMTALKAVRRRPQPQ